MTGKSNDLLTETVLQMHESITALSRDVGKISGQLATFITQMETHDLRTTDIEVRTRKVENRQHWYAGATAAIGVLASKYIPALFNHS